MDGLCAYHQEVDVKRDAEKEKFWRGVVAEAEGSGQSVREFCRCRELKESLFYFWRGQIGRRDKESGGRGGFVELFRASGPESRSGVSIRVGERVHIVVDRGFDASVLQSVLVVVMEVVPVCFR